MSREKQIEEMAREIEAMHHCEGYADDRGCYFANSCTACKSANTEKSTEMAKRLYNAGYRKLIAMEICSLMITESPIGWNFQNRRKENDMYKAPIELISSPSKFDIDGEIYKAVVQCGVSVDKDELIRALQYDRDQYYKGYADAKAEVAMEIFEEMQVLLMLRMGVNEVIAELKKKYTEEQT